MTKTLLKYLLCPLIVALMTLAVPLNAQSNKQKSSAKSAAPTNKKGGGSKKTPDDYSSILPSQDAKEENAPAGDNAKEAQKLKDKRWIKEQPKSAAPIDSVKKTGKMSVTASCIDAAGAKHEEGSPGYGPCLHESRRQIEDRQSGRTTNPGTAPGQGANVELKLGK